MKELAHSLEYVLHDCTYGLSCRRIYEHVFLYQINPFVNLTSVTVQAPGNFIDIIEVSGEEIKLAGFLLSDVLSKENHVMPPAELARFLEYLHEKRVRQWIANVQGMLLDFRTQKLVRNKPHSFLSVDAESPLGVSGIRCALREWLHNRSSQKYKPRHWVNEIVALAKKGLRKDELERTNIVKLLGASEYQKVSGSEVKSLLTYQPLNLSIIPVITKAQVQLSFSKVPVNFSVKRIKPKLKKRVETHPQWRDRVLGYWVDSVEWNDLLGKQRGWMAFTCRGEPLVSEQMPSGLCNTPREALSLAATHAKKNYPKLSTKGEWSGFRITGGEQYREWLVTLPLCEASYFSDHFVHRNVLLHMRCDVRESWDNKRILLLHEVQSDWAQQARRLLKNERSISGLAKPPWLAEWPELAIKLMLLHAVKEKLAGLAWTPGSVQVNRYRGLGKEGLIELYDRTLPAALTTILKPLGAKCQKVEVYNPINFYIEPTESGYEVLDENGELVGESATWEGARNLLPDGSHEMLQEMHGIILDDELCENINCNGFYAWGNGIK